MSASRRPFDFRRHLLPQDGRVHVPHRLTITDPSRLDSPVPKYPVARSRAMHDLLLDHCIPEYDKPWMRAVKVCRDLARQEPGHTRQHPSEKHWDAMHLAMHELVRDVLKGERGHRNDMDHMPAERSAIGHWAEIYRHIEYFQNAYPDETLDTLPSRKEFMAALPDLCKQLLAVPTPALTTDERAELERTRGARGEQPQQQQLSLAMEHPPITTDDAPEPIAPDSRQGHIIKIRRALEDAPLPGEVHSWYADLQRQFGLACTMLDEAIQHPGSNHELTEKLSEQLNQLLQANGSLHLKLDTLAEKLLVQRLEGKSVAIDKREFVRICSDYGTIRDLLPEHQQKTLLGSMQMYRLRETMSEDADRALTSIVGPLPKGPQR